MQSAVSWGFIDSKGRGTPSAQKAIAVVLQTVKVLVKLLQRLVGFVKATPLDILYQH